MDFISKTAQIGALGCLILVGIAMLVGAYVFVWGNPVSLSVPAQPPAANANTKR